MEIKIKKEKDWVFKDHYKTKNPKTQIVLANTLRKDSNHLIRLKNKDFGKTKKWPAYTVKRNGEILNHFNDNYHSDFIGFKSADVSAVSIVIENMGWLRKIDNLYYNWANEICPHECVEEKNWMGYKYWEGYSKKQMNSLRFLCNVVCDKHNILKSVISFQTYHKEIKKYRGIVLLSNYFDESTNSNPVFDLGFLS